MNSLYEIVDDFLPHEVYKDLLSLVMSDGFPFYYRDFITDSRTHDNFFFCHVLLENGSMSSWYYHNIVPQFLSKIQPSLVYRIKINAYTKDNKHTLHGYHLDNKSPHKVALWSLNTNNGYTLLKDQDNNEIKIHSVANRMVFFDGSTLHSSVSQTDENLRININFNYL